MSSWALLSPVPGPTARSSFIQVTVGQAPAGPLHMVLSTQPAAQHRKTPSPETSESLFCSALPQTGLSRSCPQPLSTTTARALRGWRGPGAAHGAARCLLQALYLASPGRPQTNSFQPGLHGHKFAHGGAEVCQHFGGLQRRNHRHDGGEQPGPYTRPELMHPSMGAGELGVTPAALMPLGKQRPCQVGLGRDFWRSAPSSRDRKRKSAFPGEEL